MLNDVISKIMNGNEMNNYKPIHNEFNINNPSPFDISRESGKIEFFEKHYKRAESKQKMGMGVGGVGAKISSYPGDNKDYGDPGKSFKRANVEKEPILLNFTDVEEIKYEVPSAYYAYQGKKQKDLTPLERGLQRDDQLEMDEDEIVKLPQARADFIRKYKQQNASQALSRVNEQIKTVKRTVPFREGAEVSQTVFRGDATVVGGGRGGGGGRGRGEIDTSNITTQGTRSNNIAVASAQARGGGESKQNDEGKKKRK